MPFNIDEFINTLDHVDKAAFADEGERVRARNAANALLSRIESPWDTFMKHVFANVSSQRKKNRKGEDLRAKHAKYS